MTAGRDVDLDWLLDNLVSRVPEVLHAIVLSNDGILMAASTDVPRDEAEELAAVAAGIQSLAKGVGRRFDGGSVRQSVVEMNGLYLFVTAAGSGACLALLARQDADIGLIAYEMTTLADRAGAHLTAPARPVDQPAGSQQ